MNPKSEYGGIDYFKMIAAILVVANHTSPLLSITETGDFILTRIVARVAVPFFFMTTGFFLVSHYLNNQEADRNKLNKFMKKSCLLYGISILLYLPINFYAGYFDNKPIMPTLLKDIVFDGTFYHLWYLPAVIIGVAGLYVLLNKFTVTSVFLIASLLYLVGLFGDSYYGIAEQMPFLKLFYEEVFSISDYTRNGLFFAPIFLILGALIAKQPRPGHLKNCFFGLVVSASLLLIEGLLLHKYSIQRHDSMYLMLIPCMFFVFQLLLLWKGKERKDLRNISMIVYIIHPFIIVLVRGFAKITSLQSLLVENSMIHFFVVALVSYGCSVILVKQMDKKRKENRYEGPSMG